MRRSDLILSTLLIADLIAVVAWFNITPSSAMIATIGLAGPRADMERHCSAGYRHEAWIRIPTRTVRCYGPFSRGRPEDRQQVEYDQLTRKVQRASVSMVVLDSATWTYHQDSIARAIAGRGGLETFCPPTYPTLTFIKREWTWRFAEFDVRLVAYRFEDHDPRASEWSLQITAVSPGAAGCGA